MEIFDVVDELGRPTGETVDRRYAHAEGIRHRTAHVWVTRRREGRTELLLQKRSAGKDSFPGWYDTSAAGHIQAGDEPLPSALRELQEELGIRAEPSQLTFAGNFTARYQLRFHHRPFRDNEVVFVYHYDGPVEEASLRLQKEEVERVDWFGLEEVRAACARRSELRKRGLEPSAPEGEIRFCVPLESLEVLEAFLSKQQGGER